MDQRSRTNFNKSFIRLVFSLGVFIYVLGTESYLPILTDYCYYASQTETELVVFSKKEIDLGFLKRLDDSPKQITDFVQPNPDFSSTHGLARLHYGATVLHRYKSCQRHFTPNHQITSILQKKNIWHQSSDEDPPAFSA